MNTSLRVLVHTLLLIALVQVLFFLAPHSTPPGIQFLLGVLAAGHGVPFAIACAGTLNNSRPMLFLLLTLFFLSSWPIPAADLVAETLPIALGLGVGVLVRRMISESRPATQPQLSEEPIRDWRSTNDRTREPLRYRRGPYDRAPIADADRPH